MKFVVITVLLFYYVALAQNLTNIQSWGYWINNLNVQTLAESKYELVVIDYSKDGSAEQKLTPVEIQQIKNNNKIVIAYISIGEAENYRFYWQDSWLQNPPLWLGPENPDWQGNYKVRFWFPEWQNIIFNYIDTIIQQGFDGIYMDIIDAYEYWKYENPEEPKADSLMIDFILKIRNYVNSKTNNFILIPQNGETIIYESNVSSKLKLKFFNAINGIGVEDVFFPGNLPENNEFNPDSTRLNALNEFLKNNKQVFSIEYLTNSEKINLYLTEANKYNFVPYYCTRELNRLCDKNYNENDFIIYPNPNFEPYLNLFVKKFPYNGELNVKIYNSLGELIYNKRIQSNTISEYLEIPQGIYFVKVETNDFTSSKVWIIANY